jgi:hypothetical protein
MTQQSLQTIPTQQAQRRQFQADLQEAQRRLLEAEKELAEKQAVVNAFRMQCRLKLGHLIDDYLELRGEKQALWTQLQLLQQAQEFGIPYDADDPFWQGREEPHLHDELPQDELVREVQGSVRDRAAEKRLYRELARRFHPDRAASGVEKAYMTMMMTAVNVAYAQRNLDALRDLADELDPQTATDLALVQTGDLRRLREQILRLQRRRRRVLRQLEQLQQEHTTRLWHKAAELEANGRPWWEDVRHELHQLITRRQQEIMELQTAVNKMEGMKDEG